MTAIPEEGFSSDDILDVLKQWRSCEKGYRSGKQFGGIYTDDKVSLRGFVFNQLCSNSFIIILGIEINHFSCIYDVCRLERFVPDNLSCVAQNGNGSGENDC